MGIQHKKLSIIIVSYNNKDIIARCIAAVIKSCEGIEYEIIVVDNASHDGTPDFVRNNFTDIILLEQQKNLGFSAGNNIGIRQASGELILLLNSDAIMIDSLKSAIDIMSTDRSIGLMGAAIYNANMEMQSPVKRYPTFISELYKLTVFSIRNPHTIFFNDKLIVKRYEAITDVDWVEGCFMLTRKDLIKAVGYMDERYFFYYEDIELCYTIKNMLRLRVVYYPFIRVKHIGGESTNLTDALYLDRYYKSCRAYFKKHKGNLYTVLFYISCLTCWLILFIGLIVARLLVKSERIIRKCDMLRYAIKNAVLEK